MFGVSTRELGLALGGVGGGVGRALLAPLLLLLSPFGGESDPSSAPTRSAIRAAWSASCFRCFSTAPSSFLSLSSSAHRLASLTAAPSVEAVLICRTAARCASLASIALFFSARETGFGTVGVRTCGGAPRLGRSAAAALPPLAAPLAMAANPSPELKLEFDCLPNKGA